MRDDLLEARACVDWAVAQIPSLTDRIESWLATNVEIRISDNPAPATHDTIVAVEKEFFPLSFNVEVGAYINCIRSSLDLLATALAYRFGIPKPESHYFPIARSAAEFAAGTYKGRKLIEGLPTTERGLIESLEPYQGGNKALWALHDLDVKRKHRRLVDVTIVPRDFSLTGTAALHEGFAPVRSIEFIRSNNETILGLIRKGAARYQIQFTPQVSFTEPGFLHRMPVVMGLERLARRARVVIDDFDT